MTIWTLGAGGIVLFSFGIVFDSPIIQVLWLFYSIALLGLMSYWGKHINKLTENLALEAPDSKIADLKFLLRFTEGQRVERNLSKVFRKLQLAEFSILNQKARQAGENFNLMLSNTTDPLTGVPNRRELDRHLDKVSEKMKPLSVIMVDIDHFKKVNDTYGHDAGDLVLQQFASIVRASIRPADFLGRYGGEEFLVICNADLEGTAEIAERVRSAVYQTPVKVSNEMVISVTASFGIAQQNHGEDPYSTVKRADIGLYSAKQNGRNRVERGENTQLCVG